MGKIISDEKGEYSFLSDSGVKYSLYEGKTIGFNTTSDIVFVMNDNCIEISTELVGWVYGAFMINLPNPFYNPNLNLSISIM